MEPMEPEPEGCVMGAEPAPDCYRGGSQVLDKNRGALVVWAAARFREKDAAAQRWLPRPRLLGQEPSGSLSSLFVAEGQLIGHWSRVEKKHCQAELLNEDAGVGCSCGEVEVLKVCKRAPLDKITNLSRLTAPAGTVLSCRL